MSSHIFHALVLGLGEALMLDEKDRDRHPAIPPESGESMISWSSDGCYLLLLRN